MRVLHAAKITGIAGTENYLLHTLPALMKKGVEISFLCLTPKKQKGSESAFVAQLKEMGIVVHTLYYRRISFQLQKKIRKIIKASMPDLVHTHMIHADFFLALSRFFSKKKFKIVSTKHGYDEGYMSISGFEINGKKNLRYQQVAKWSERQIYRSYAISKGLRKLFIAHHICAKDKIDLIYHGFDFNIEPSESSKALRKSDQQLVMVGRFTALKGHKEAVYAISHLSKQYPDIHLMLVGDGQIKNKIEELTQKLKLSNHISFEGYQANSTAYMEAADLVLVPSKAEGFGLVVLEAYAVKKPVVAFDNPAINELVIDKETGLLAKPDDPEDLAAKISLLIEDKATCKTYGMNGFQLLNKKFSADVMIDQMIRFYQKCID